MRAPHVHEAEPLRLLRQQLHQASEGGEEMSTQSKHVWIVQQTGVWGLDSVTAYATERAAMAQALELVVYWEDHADIGQPVETKTRGLHRWSWPSEGERPDFTVLLIQTPVQHW